MISNSINDLICVVDETWFYVTSLSPLTYMSASTKHIAVSNQKGGVGKTMVAINLAGALNQRGYTVLFVDADPQGNATEGLGLADIYEEPDLTSKQSSSRRTQRYPRSSRHIPNWISSPRTSIYSKARPNLSPIFRGVNASSGDPRRRGRL